ncbi:MAG: dUTP diphosphatase [Clostridium sp.]|uniref:dUTP diphosphatase n=1 Tax=Clostridium sp. TaxID=1506 RepID=UPI003F3F292B
MRGFGIVREECRKNNGYPIVLPQRGTERSAGYDIRIPVEVTLQPGEKRLVFTDINAYMQDDEVLELHVRSSIGVKKGIVLCNMTGIIDADYIMGDNNGNIGFPLWNTSDKVVTLEAQERVCQGIFKKYLITDDDNPIKSERKGGFGSTGEV